MRFRKGRRGEVALEADDVEATVLTQLVGDLVVLLGDDEDEDDGAPADPLAVLTGLTGRQPVRPSDPALARLLPDAYGDDDEAATDFRRYTESDLRAGKRAAATAVLATLAPLTRRGGTAPLDREQADAWLGCLNDLRLVLGTRLQVTDDTDLDVAPDDPQAQALHVYAWLGWLQEQLLSRLEPLPPGGPSGAR